MTRLRQPHWSILPLLGLSLFAVSCKKDAPHPAAAATAAVSAAHPGAAVAAAAVSAAHPGAAVAAASASGAPANSERPLSYDRPITDDDLAKRPLRELSLMRNYVFARAGQEFRKDWLREYFSQYPWYHPTKTPAEVDQLGRDNAEKIANYDAAIGHDELRRRADAVLARREKGAPESNDALELRLLSERLGEWLAPKDAAEHPSPLENPAMLDQVLTLDDLGNLSRRDLRILRNTVYARKGRDFDSQGLRDYFGEKDWYKIDPKYSDQRLSAVDWKNIKLVASVEDTLGGPISDGAHFGRKYGWFSGA
jgi:hypothetical protein